MNFKVKIARLLFAIAAVASFSGYSQQLKTENVFLITLDGLRWQELYTGADPQLIDDKGFVGNPEELKKTFWSDDAYQRREMLFPFIWSELAKKGQLYGNRLYGNKVDCTNGRWFSYPGYSEILTGFADDKQIKSNDKINNPNVTVLEYINRQRKFEGKVAAFGSWDVFPYIINADRSGVPVNAGFMEATGSHLTKNEVLLNTLQEEIPGPWGSVRLDAFTHHFAMEYIKKNSPRLLYIAYGETDDWAHDGKYDEYLYSAQRTDKFIKELWDFVQSHPRYRNKTTFIITTDHGRGTEPKHTWKSHGSDVTGAGEIWLMAIGPDTPATGEVTTEGQLYQNQVAATVASLLGIVYKNSPEPGKAVSSIFGRN